MWFVLWRKTVVPFVRNVVVAGFSLASFALQLGFGNFLVIILLLNRLGVLLFELLVFFGFLELGIDGFLWSLA